MDSVYGSVATEFYLQSSSTYRAAFNLLRTTSNQPQKPRQEMAQKSSTSFRWACVGFGLFIAMAACGIWSLLDRPSATEEAPPAAAKSETIRTKVRREAAQKKAADGYIVVSGTVSDKDFKFGGDYGAPPENFQPKVRMEKDEVDKIFKANGLE